MNIGDSKSIAIITARGGSKRIPRKNIRAFAGIPMIAHAIRIATDSAAFARIIVSTDDEEIAAISRAWGAETPFMRPPELADDTATTAAVMRHAVRWCLDSGIQMDEACCIYPGIPLLPPEYIAQARELMRARKKSYCFSVLRFEAPIQRALRLTDHGVEMFSAGHADTRSQDLEPAYHDAGQFYWGTPEAWLESRAIFSPATAALVIPRHCAVDIDTLEDWEFAERLYASTRNDLTRARS